MPYNFSREIRRASRFDISQHALLWASPWPRKRGDRSGCKQRRITNIRRLLSTADWNLSKHAPHQIALASSLALVILSYNRLGCRTPLPTPPRGKPGATTEVVKLRIESRCERNRRRETTTRVLNSAAVEEVYHEGGANMVQVPRAIYVVKIVIILPFMSANNRWVLHVFCADNITGNRFLYCLFMFDPGVLVTCTGNLSVIIHIYI